MLLINTPAELTYALEDFKAQGFKVDNNMSREVLLEVLQDLKNWYIRVIVYTENDEVKIQYTN